MNPIPQPLRLPAPDPDTGWSRCVLRVAHARIDPEHGGVWIDGAALPEAMLHRWGGVYRGWKGSAPNSAAWLPGRHLWGGTLFFHFGHFLAESLSRLWAIEGSGAESILFTPKSLSGKRPEDLATFQKHIIARLGIDLPIRILYDPVEVEDLIVPGQGFGLGAMAPGTPEFRAFARRLDPGPGKMTGRRLYVSRTKLPKKTGSVLGEAALERMLKARGFEIFHPQVHSIDDQLRAFRDADEILGPDGSAFHLAGFIAQSHQRFTILKRRSAREYKTFQDQLLGNGARVRVIDAVAADWVRPGRHKADDMSWGELDFALLSQSLEAAGLIDCPLDSNSTDWSEELLAIGAVHRGNMERLPVADSIGRDMFAQ